MLYAHVNVHVLLGCHTNIAGRLGNPHFTLTTACSDDLTWACKLCKQIEQCV